MKRPAILAALLAFPAFLQGQTRLEITPFVGAYSPTSERIVRSDSAASPAPPTTVTEGSGSAIGARFALWGRGRLGLEGSFTFVIASLQSEWNQGPVLATSGEGNLVVVSARGLWGLGPTGFGGNRAFHLLAGLTLVSHGGSWSPTWEGTTDLGGVVGVGANVALGDVILRLGLEDHIFAASFDQSSTGTTPSRLQNDILVSAGVAVSFKKR